MPVTDAFDTIQVVDGILYSATEEFSVGYDESAEALVYSNASTGAERLRIPLSGTPNFPNGLAVNGNGVLTTASTIDADTLDGVDSSDFGSLSDAETVTGNWTFDAGQQPITVANSSSTTHQLGLGPDALIPADDGAVDSARYLHYDWTNSTWRIGDNVDSASAAVPLHVGAHRVQTAADRAEFAQRIRTIHVSSASGGAEYVKLATITDGGANEAGWVDATLDFAAPASEATARRVHLTASSYQSTLSVESDTVGGDPTNPVDLVITQTSGTGANGYDEAHLYARASDAAAADVRLHYGSQFGGVDVQTGLGSSDLVGGVVYDTAPAADGANADVSVGSVTAETVRPTHGHGPLSFPSHHIRYSSGLSNAEITRFTLASDEKLELWRLETKFKGGGTNSNFSVDVYDASAASVIASTSDKVEGGDTPVGTSTTGATILVRISNSTGSDQVACLSGLTTIVSG